MKAKRYYSSLVFAQLGARVMGQRVDGLAIQFHFEQRNKSAIDLVEAIAIVGMLEISNGEARELIRSASRKLLDELRSDQVLLSLIRLWMMTGYDDGKFELPPSIDFVTTKFIPRGGRAAAP